MLSNLLSSLSDELYSSSTSNLPNSDYIASMGSDSRTKTSKRLAECLPGFSNWGKGVWGGLPDSGVEGLLSLGGYEGFAGLIFADWA